MRLHATGGYLTVRHGLIPGMILTMAAAHGLTWLMAKAAIPGRWLGLARRTPAARPGRLGRPARRLRHLSQRPTPGAANAGPYSVYVNTGRWIAEHADASERVLDLTNWSLFFSERPGYPFANVYEAPSDQALRWIVVRKPHVEGHWHYSQVLRGLIGDRQPVARSPTRRPGSQVQIRIYDLKSPSVVRTAAGVPDAGAIRR